MVAATAPGDNGGSPSTPDPIEWDRCTLSVVFTPVPVRFTTDIFAESST